MDTGVIVVYLKQGAGGVIMLLMPSVQPKSKFSPAAASVRLPNILQFLTGQTSSVASQPHALRGRKEVSFASRAICLEG